MYRSKIVLCTNIACVKVSNIYHVVYHTVFIRLLQEMMKSMLPNSVLGKIWKLADVNKDGMLDLEEFALAMHLIQVKLDGYDLPQGLPEHLLPPSQRSFPLTV